MGSVVVESRLTTVFGWWDWDAETPALVNRVTGERVAFRGRFEDPSLVPTGETWLRFDYLHPELNFPLLVCENLVDLSRHGTRAAWSADYEKSAALWRQETQPSAVIPHYGAWRRIDDCLTDALACWSDTVSISKPLSGSVVFRGGWLNGEWAPEWQRSYDRLPERHPLTLTSSESDSWLQPLTEPPPSRWVFHPFLPQPQAGVSVHLEAQVLLKGLLIEGKGAQRRLILPSGVPLNNLEGQAAYLLTEDGKRLLYPMAGETDPVRSTGHSSPKFRLLYVEEDLLCELFGRPIGNRAGLARWSISSVPASLGLRSPGAAAVVERAVCGEASRFSRRFWLKIEWALFDAWSQWSGTTARSQQWVNGLHLNGADAVTVRAGYRGGQWMGNLRSTIANFRYHSGRLQGNGGNI